MNDLLIQIIVGLQVATTAVVSVGVLIVGIALVYRGISIATGLIDMSDVPYDDYEDLDTSEEGEQRYQEYLERTERLHKQLREME